MEKNKSLLGEFWEFLKVKKSVVANPEIILLILIITSIIFGQSSAVSPFIYALF